MHGNFLISVFLVIIALTALIILLVPIVLIVIALTHVDYLFASLLTKCLELILDKF